METLIAPVPSSGLNRNKRPRILGMQFGDGYGSVTPDGINILLMEIEPAWRLLSFEAADALDNFLSQQKGQSFLWQLPREVTPRVWRCDEWSYVEGTTTGDITAKFKEQPA